MVKKNKSKNTRKKTQQDKKNMEKKTKIKRKNYETKNIEELQNEKEQLIKEYNEIIKSKNSAKLSNIEISIEALKRIIENKMTRL